MIYDYKVVARLIATVHKIPSEKEGLIKNIKCVESDDEQYMLITYGFQQNGCDCVKLIRMPIKSFNTWYNIYNYEQGRE